MSNSSSRQIDFINNDLLLVSRDRIPAFEVVKDRNEEVRHDIHCLFFVMSKSSLMLLTVEANAIDDDVEAEGAQGTTEEDNISTFLAIILIGLTLEELGEVGVDL